MGWRVQIVCCVIALTFAACAGNQVKPSARPSQPKPKIASNHAKHTPGLSKNFSNFQARRTLIGQKDGLDWLSYSGDGKHILTANKQGQIHIWDGNGGLLVSVFREHKSKIVACAFPVGDTVLSVDNTGHMIHWRISTRGVMSRMSVSKGVVLDVQVGADSRFAVTSSEDGIVRLWNLETGGFEGYVDLKAGAINAAKFSPDGKYIAAVSAAGRVALLDALTLDVIFSKRGHEAPVRQLRFSDDSKSFATICQDGVLREWDIRSQKASLKSLASGLGSRSLVFSNDGKYLAENSGRSMTIWDARKWQVVRYIRGVILFSFNPNNKGFVAAEFNGVVKIWDKRGNESQRPHVAEVSFDARQGAVNWIEYSPAGDTFVTVGDDGTAKVWQAPDNKLIYTIEASNKPLICATYSPNGAEIAMSGWGRGVLGGEIHTAPLSMISIFSFDKQRIVRRYRAFTDAIYSLDYRPDGQALCATGHDYITEFDPNKNYRPINYVFRKSNLLYGEGGHTIRWGTTPFVMKWWSGAYSPDSKLRTVVSNWGYTFVTKTSRHPEYSKVSGAYRARANIISGTGFVSNPSDKFCVAFTPDSKSFAVADRSGSIWERGIGTQNRYYIYRSGKDSAVYSIEYSPKGYLLAAAGDGFVEIWSTSSGAMIHEDNAHNGVTYDIAFSPDGSKLASVGKDGRVVIRDVASTMSE